MFQRPDPEQQVIRPNLKGLRQIDKDRKTQLGIPCFDVTHVGNRDPHQPGQFLLGKSMAFLAFLILCPIA